jgi:3-oxoisoapionate decarboxylase
MTRRAFVAAASAAAARAAAPAIRSGMGFSPDCFGISRAPSRDPYEYLQYGYDRGAGGVQAILTNFDPAYLKKVRQRAEELGMYLEITTMLPRDDASPFEQTVKAAREAGASCMRSVCLGGRRYENFASLQEWNAFVEDSHARLQRAVRIVEAQRMPLALENHKDWTIDQMAPLLKQYSSEYLGACIDWGNNMSLLDDPVEVVERLAPFAMASHIKDMDVEEYAEGFYLAEVPLGQGMLPLRKMLACIQSARPSVRHSLDMLTRNPLTVPCLTPKYWATFADRNGKYLANTLRMVRTNKPKKPLVRLDGMDQNARQALEQENVRQSVVFARDGLGLKV